MAFRFLLVSGTLVVLVAASCSPGPVREGAIAPGVTKNGMLQLSLGMSEKQVVDILGVPLESKRRENRVVLEFAHHKQLGDGDSAPPLSGISISAGFGDDRLELLSVVDVDASARCTCNRKECSKDWLKACEKHLPEAAR